MKKVVDNVVAVDVSNYDLESSTLRDASSSLYSTHPSFRSVVDSLNAQFDSMFSGDMLRFYSRSAAMCRPLYDYLSELVEKDSRPIYTVLFDAVKGNGIVNANLTTCMRLLRELDYVQLQVGQTFVDQVWFRTQQALRLNSVKQTKAFVNAYYNFPKRESLEKHLMPLVGNCLSRIQSSGLPSGCQV